MSLQSASLIVEDDADVRPGQARKGEFLARLRGEVCSAADQALQAAGRSTEGCPYIGRWFDYYASRGASEIERAVHRYVPETAGAAAAADYVAPIVARVTASVRGWATSGELTGVPTEGAVPPGAETSALAPAATPAPTTGTVSASAASGTAPPVQSKRRDGGHRTPADPHAVRSRLGPGRALDGSVRTRMERAFGDSFAPVRIHTDQAAGSLATELGARAFTVGSEVAFAPGEYRPGSFAGDALIAHELAHTIQQRNGQGLGVARSSSVAHETEADEAAVEALSGRPSHGPRLRSGLALQRCNFAPNPPAMSTPQQKAAWISHTMQEDLSLAGDRIVEAFATAQTQNEFDAIQRLLNMDEVAGYLSDWNLVRLGALGPLRGGTDLLNEKRADVIVDFSHDFGIARGQVFAAFIFNNAANDEIEDVLRRLVAGRRMHLTLDQMPLAQEILRNRGIDLSRFRDPGALARNFGRGVATGVGDFLSSSDIKRNEKGMHYFNVGQTLPEEYQQVLGAIDTAELNQILEPSNLALGAADYLTFGIVGGPVNLVRSTARGIRDLAAGDTEEAGQELAGAITLVLSFVGVRAYRAARGAAIRSGIRLPGFPEPITEAQAILGRTLPLNADAAAAGGALIERLGRQGMLDVAGYIQARRAAGLFVAEGGLDAAEALSVARGDVPRARALLESRRAATQPPPAAGQTAPSTPPPTPAMSAVQRLWVAGFGPAAAARVVGVFIEAGLGEGRVATLSPAAAEAILRADQALAAGALRAAGAELDALAELTSAERDRVGSTLSRMHGQPDLPTVGRAGAVSDVRASSNRRSEAPYHEPPDMVRVRPRQPLGLDRLEPGPVRPRSRERPEYASRGPTYLWVVDEEGVIRVAREDQPGYVSRRGGTTETRPVKHGDLTPSPATPTAGPGAIRGAARAGGELYWAVDSRTGRGRWVLDNNSSYSFNRADFVDGNMANLQAVRDLLRAAGSDVTTLELRDWIAEQR